ncbi:MAG: rRNA pseudouridine synthase [Clostridia bacterium]|nr:rRNA pseudouridine synthase [Clostridia bacterium]
MERLDKIIANSGTLSRKEVHRLIKSGAISVNGITTKDRGFCIDPETAEIKINGQPVSLEKYVYIMLNKPEGVVSATKDPTEKTVVDLVPAEFKKKNLFPAGRLDRNTTGFVLITDNGDFAHKILSPKNHIEKTYEARLAEKIDAQSLQKVAQGITLGDGTECLPAKVKILEDGENPLIEIKICEGKYHQIKRMFAAVGNAVIELKRVKMGELPLDEALAPGECKILSKEEVEMIQK